MYIFKFVLFWLACVLAGCGEHHGENPSAVAPVESFDQLIANHNCLGCHAPGNRMNLPVWHEVAKKYQNKPDAAAYLSHKIKTGGSGAWGKMDMPPYQELEESELKVIVQQVLASNKGHEE
jgi:cytochrome c